MKIALDAMGGDHAPAEVVLGGVQAARDLGVGIAFVGQDAALKAELARHDTAGLDLEIVHAQSVIRMDEHASRVRTRRDSSIAVAAQLVKDGRASALVSAGHTGATMAATLLLWGRIEGIERPALTTVFPTARGCCLVADVGANVDCRPEYLAQFGLMGSIYAERVLGIDQPKVGLLNIGEEATKGNQLVLRARELLRVMPIAFVGNVEGKDLPAGTCDVVVCDGFVGNVALKTAEGVANFIITQLREEVDRSLWYRLGAALMLPALRALKHKMDYEEYGGAPLLGVKGVAIVCHGRSRAKAIRHAIRVARDAAAADVVTTIRAGVANRSASRVSVDSASAGAEVASAPE